MKEIIMKDIKASAPPSQMTADSQNRLLAYSTAASLGAFFAGQSAEAAVVQAPGLAPYPHVILPQPVGSTNGTYLNLSIEGGSITNFGLLVTPDLLSHPTNKFPSQVVRMPGIIPDTNNPAVVNGQVLAALRATAGSHDFTNAYCVAFLGGAIIGNNTNSTAPWYHPQLAISYNYGAYPWVNYVNNGFPSFPSEFLGFKFTSSADGQSHFGYLKVQCNFVTASIDYLDPSGNPATATKQVLQSVVINDCRYETTPEADITVPPLIKVTKILNNLDGSVTINFGPNSTENDDASVFALETSPTLGPSASWTIDSNLSQLIQLTAGTPTRPATYQAVTVPAPGATSQFYRIKKL